MADEPHPSAPPREPVDVTTTPDSPPARPFDVPTFPDAPPAIPFDVPITPSGPPAVPFDVRVQPDGPPVEPFDVRVTPDLPPGTPADVPTTADLPPTAPFDVPVTPDAPPRAPVDVSVRPDGPPVTPFDVTTAPDAPPGAPMDVPTSPDLPPTAPFDVTVTPDAQILVGTDGRSLLPDGFDVPTTPDPMIVVGSDGRALLPDGFDVQVDKDVQISPDNVWIGPTPTSGDSSNVQIDKDRFDPADVADNQDPGVPALPYPLPSTPNIDGLIEVVSDYDRTLANFLSNLVEVDLVNVIAPGGGALDPRLLAGWFKNWLDSAGAAGVARFVAEQAILYAMNPVTARIFNPLYFILMSLPGSMGNIPTTVDVAANLTMERAAQARDTVLQGRVFLSPDRPAGDGKADQLDVYGPENKYSDGQAYSVDSIVNGALGELNGPPFTSTRTGVTRFDANTFFEDRRSDGASLTRREARIRAAAGIENVSTTKLAASVALDGVIRVRIPGEEIDGSVLSTTQDPSEVVDDDDARVPLSFTDLRQVPGKKFRSVYFRPTGLQLSEQVSPEYNESTAFGRVDSVVGYVKTQRTVTVSFEVHALAPEDLRVMYNKMIWLKSMCYPTFGSDSLIQSGPVVRMRIGDVVGTDLGGIPGVIRNLSFDFADAMWELKRGMKVPRMFKVSLDFLVLHDGPVGTVNGVFGVFQLPPGGPRPDKNTNMAGNPTDSREQSPEGVTSLPGRFARFGEPRS